ncbi:MAG: nucleotidyltransferase domain-containing protein [Spirochaetaceae bacterium]|nr:nucleotidyltransferase domain-containing protein [Spirochaetaceae bacterium]
MSVSPRATAEFLRRKQRLKDEALDVRFAEMQRDAGAIVAGIAERFSPVRIYQWGSLLDRGRFREYSDIDIAVEGITDAETYIQLEAMAWDMTDFPLDLVQLEHIEPEYADIIRQKGVVVYERTP